MKKFLKILFKILGKLILAAVIFFAATFTLYMVNGENKLIYYVVRPLLNKHYDSQVRDRRIVCLIQTNPFLLPQADFPSAWGIFIGRTFRTYR